MNRGVSVRRGSSRRPVGWVVVGVVVAAVAWVLADLVMTSESLTSAWWRLALLAGVGQLSVLVLSRSWVGAMSASVALALGLLVKLLLDEGGPELWEALPLLEPVPITEFLALPVLAGLAGAWFGLAVWARRLS